jgi:prepilin-type processing-associated H-X9-DG protein
MSDFRCWMCGKRAFTLPCLLVVLSLLAVLGLYLLPLYQGYKSKHEASICITNLRRLGQSTLMYASDFDETLPPTVGNINGQWLTNFWCMTPPNWSSLTTHPAVIASKFIWPNNSRDYGITDSDLYCPSQRFGRIGLARFTYDTPLGTPGKVSYSMNGLVSSYRLTNISNTSAVPLIWEGHGRFGGLGGILQNPLLTCSDGTQPCVYNTGCSSSTNGGTGGGFGFDGSVWVHGKRNHWLFIDGHVEGRLMGAVLAPGTTDNTIDPYYSYNDAGIPGFLHTNGCAPDLFRPDR